MREFKTSDFDYFLPPDLIAQFPAAERSASRLLQVNVSSQAIHHGQFTEVIQLFQPNDLIVFNNTKVIPARLFGRKTTGGNVECLIERILSPRRALVQLKVNKSLKPQAEIIFDNSRAIVIAQQNNFFEIEFLGNENIIDLLNRIGHLPLPPYINRTTEHFDKERYQTIYAEKLGAVAAPTAGLHFDERVMKAIEKKGVTKAFITLHVGAGTFKPVRAENLEDHQMHYELMEISHEVCNAIQECKQKKGRVIAVGTTVVRCLETAFQNSIAKPMCAETNIFIRPGFKFNCVDAMITNFHLPKSTLLMLVSAFAGYELMMNVYREAVEQKYRFFSYGDAMWINNTQR